MVGQAYRGSTISHAQRVRTGVRLVMIKMVRMMKGDGDWQVLDGTVTDGAP